MKNLKLAMAVVLLLIGNWALVSAETRTVIFEGINTNFVTKDDITVERVSTSQGSQAISCLNASNVSYLSLNSNSGYLQLTTKAEEKIDKVNIIWRSGTTEQLFPIIFGEEIVFNSSGSPSNLITATKGGFATSSTIATSGATNCPDGDEIVFPDGATVKSILIARLIRNNPDANTMNTVYDSFQTRLSSGSGYTVEVCKASNVFIGRLELTISTIVSCTPAAVSFADGKELSKAFGDAPFTNGFTTDNTSTAAYTSSNTSVATVNATSGEVTIAGIGETTISVAQAADDTYCAVDTAYTLTVTPPAAIYEITPSSNNSDLGTVSLADAGTAVITAVPDACSEYADPAYTVVNGTAEVYQSGNTFIVIASTDCAIQINFVAKPVYTVTLDPGSGRLADGETALTQADCVSPVTLPAALSCADDWVFAGWAAAEIEEATTTAPVLIAAGDYLPESNSTLYAVYSFTETSDTETVLFNEQFTGQTATEGSTGSNITFDETWTRGTGTLYYTEVNAITLRNNVKYYTSSLDLQNPETIIEFKAKYETAPTYNSEAISRSAICVNDNGTTTNNGFQFEVQPDNSVIFKKSGSGVTGDPEFLSETLLTGEFQTFKVKINGSYVNAALDGTDNIAIRVASSNSIPLVIGSFKVYTFPSTTTYDSNPECSPCTPPASGAFAEEAVTKTVGDPAFTNTFTPGENTSPVVYESSDETVATVDAATGEVTIRAVGETTIKATQAEDDTYCATEASYTLTVNNPVYAITAQSDNTDYGTVVLAENKITALPVKGYQLANPAYQVTPEEAATVAKDGNVFTVTATADVTVQIIFEALPAPLTWNFSDTEFEAGNYTEATVIGGLTLGPNTTLETNDKSLDGYNFTHRFKLNGSGSATNRFVSFPVTGDTTITIYGMSASNGAERTLKVVAGETEIGTFVNSATGSVLGKGTVNYRGGAATVYLYSANSGFNLYAINLTAPVVQTYTFTAQSNNTDYGTVTVEDNVITAVPADGYRIIAENPYTIDPAGSASVTQSENTFTVADLTADCTITINFELITGIGSMNRSGLKIQRIDRIVSLVSDSSDPIRQIVIYDLQGRLIHDRQVNAASYTLQEEMTPAGVYIVKVFTEKNVKNIKILK